MSASISITHSELVEAIHLISHQQARLWAPTPQCGCVDRADAMWDHLKQASGLDCGADYCVDPGNCQKHDGVAS